jgi:hypothetical protein
LGKLRRGLGDGKYDFVHMISGTPQNPLPPSAASGPDESPA